MINPVLCTHASLLWLGPGSDKPRFLNFPTVLTLMRNKSLTELVALTDVVNVGGRCLGGCCIITNLYVVAVVIHVCPLRTASCMWACLKKQLGIAGAACIHVWPSGEAATRRGVVLSGDGAEVTFIVRFNLFKLLQPGVSTRGSDI